MLGGIWGQEEKGMTEDEMAGWHHWLDGREFEWTPGDGDGQGGLACCDSWGRRVRHDWVTELNWTDYSGERNGNPLQYSYWEIPLTEEPGRLQSIVLQRVRHDQAHTYDRLLPLFLESKLWVVYIFNKVDKFSYLDVSYVSYLDEINNVWLQVRKNIIKKLFLNFQRITSGFWQY